jgi:hypothetical protein
MGDRVKVIGSPIKFAQNDERVLLARQIIHKMEVLSLRNRAGSPYWVAFHKGQVSVEGSNSTISGQIIGQNQINVENTEETAYQLRTGDGLINIAAAPNWFMEQTGLGFKVGDNVTVYSGSGAAHYGNNIILANGIYSSGSTLILRPNGIPVWNGWSRYNGPAY